MKQIGARQEAGLIGGLGVCGRSLCCSKYISNFQSISTQAARCQDLSLNPQKLAGQCGKLKCCINYEVPVYVDAHNNTPVINAPLEFQDGPAWLVKTDILKGIMWFSYEEGNMSKMMPLTTEEVRRIKAANHKGIKPATLLKEEGKEEAMDFVSSIGDDSIDRFDKKGRKKKRKKDRQGPTANPPTSNDPVRSATLSDSRSAVRSIHIMRRHTGP